MRTSNFHKNSFDLVGRTSFRLNSHVRFHQVDYLSILVYQMKQFASSMYSQEQVNLDELKYQSKKGISFSLKRLQMTYLISNYHVFVVERLDQLFQQ